ncbi:MAG: site-specific integrase [Candidatus Aenigmatarchaeota archaeon]|nr:site-specific integrase [Candidatus Aenigmarchaeota archaeon]
MQLKDITQFKSAQKMLGELKLLTRSENTEKTYLKGLGYFVKTMNINNLDEFIENIKTKTLNPDEIYKNFVISLANKNLAPKTVGAWSAALRKFLLSNGIELKNTPQIKIYNVHEDTLPSKEDLKKILSRCSLRTKAIILLLASSGLRVGELRNLKLSDVDLNSEPGIIKVKGLTAKERKSRITFLSNEAKQFLRSYLEHRKNNGHQLTEESFLFATHDGNQMSYQNLQFILNNIFKKISKKEGKRYKLHAHSLRKFFKTQLISAGVPGPIVDRLAGHTRYLAREYELYTEDQLKEWFIKGMKNLELLS